MTTGSPGNRFSTEVRARAARMVLEDEANYKSRSQAAASIAAKFGCNSATLRDWVNRQAVEDGDRDWIEIAFEDGTIRVDCATGAPRGRHGGDENCRDCAGDWTLGLMFPSNCVRVLVSTQPVDVRKGHNGLAAIVSPVRKDPFNGTVFVLSSRRADRLNLLYRDGTGLVMACKRLVEPVLFVVPQDRPLVISARVNPSDIDQVRAGQDAVVMFSGLNLRDLPQLGARVTKVSADAFTYAELAQSYYRVELQLLDESRALLADQALLPGMPVEVFLQTGDRSPLQYLTEPFLGYFSRALREG